MLTDDTQCGFNHNRLAAQLGCHVEYYAQVASTNDIAIARGKVGAQEGTLIITDYQHAGRGRYGRKWDAPPGKCLLISCIFRHRLLRDEVALPNLIGAIGIAKAINATTGLDARIKAPNDVRIRRKKVAGVLTEFAYDTQNQPFFVLGFGVNVNNVLDDFPCEIRQNATSLRIALNANVELCKTALLQTILHRLAALYRHLKSGNRGLIMARFNELCESTDGNCGQGSN